MQWKLSKRKCNKEVILKFKKIKKGVFYNILFLLKKHKAKIFNR